MHNTFRHRPLTCSSVIDSAMHRVQGSGIYTGDKTFAFVCGIDFNGDDAFAFAGDERFLFDLPLGLAGDEKRSSSFKSKSQFSEPSRKADRSMTDDG